MNCNVLALTKTLQQFERDWKESQLLCGFVFVWYSTRLVVTLVVLARNQLSDI